MASTKRQLVDIPYGEIHPPYYLEQAGIKFMINYNYPDYVLYVYRRHLEPRTRYTCVGKIKLRYNALPFHEEKYTKIFLTNEYMGKTFDTPEPPTVFRSEIDSNLWR